MIEKNLESLDKVLFETIQKVQNGQIKENDAKVIMNLGGKIIDSQKTQLEAFTTRKKFGIQTYSSEAESKGIESEEVKTLPQSEKVGKELEKNDNYSRRVRFSTSLGYSSTQKAIESIGGPHIFRKEFKKWESKNY